jgi:hypothetical protein
LYEKKLAATNKSTHSKECDAICTVAGVASADSCMIQLRESHAQFNIPTTEFHSPKFLIDGNPLS